MALFEALAWADSIEQLLSKGAGERGGNPGWEQNLDTNEADIIQAFICARGAVHHQWWEAMALHVVPPTEHDEQRNTWVWADLPANANLRGKKALEGQRAYVGVLHKRPVIDAIEVLRKAFRMQIRPSELRDRLYLNSP